MKSFFTINEIEELAEGVVLQFLGTQPEFSSYVDIEGFLTKYLRLPLEYRSFAETDFGKIGFISDGITPLRVMESRQPVQRVFPKGTVVLEKYLLNERENGRRRFTLAHEASHYIMDKTISAAAFHREYGKECAYSPRELKELLSFREAQVDRLAAALLMPGFMVRTVLSRFAGTEAMSIYGDNLLRLEDKLLVKKMASAMGVSYTAFLIRLKELHLLERHGISEYIKKIGLESGSMVQ